MARSSPPRGCLRYLGRRPPTSLLLPASVSASVTQRDSGCFYSCNGSDTLPRCDAPAWPMQPGCFAHSQVGEHGAAENRLTGVHSRGQTLSPSPGRMPQTLWSHRASGAHLKVPRSLACFGPSGTRTQPSSLGHCGLPPSTATPGRWWLFFSLATSHQPASTCRRRGPRWPRPSARQLARCRSADPCSRRGRRRW